MVSKQCRKAMLAMCVLTAISGSVFAAEPMDDFFDETKDIVVTGTRFKQDIKDAPASMSVVTEKDILEKGYNDFGELLSDVEGVDVRSKPGRAGNAQISLRGMDSKHTLIMVDGVPQNGPSTSDISQNGFGNVFQSFMPPMGSIERVEVVRGPMSTLYGSDAMGGVINIITKKVSDEPHGDFNINHTFETDHGRGDTTRVSGSLRTPLVKDHVGLDIRGSYLLRRPSSVDTGNFFAQNGTVRGANFVPSKMKNFDIGTKISWTPSKSQYYWLDFDNSRIDQSNQWAPNPSYDPIANPKANPYVANGNNGRRVDRKKITAGSENKVKWGKVYNTLSYIETKGHDIYLNENSNEPKVWNANLKRYVDNFDRELRTKNFMYELRGEVTKWDKHKSNFGIRMNHEAFYDNVLKYTYDKDGNRLHTGLDHLTSTDWSVYGEDTWSFNPKLSFTYGLRYEHPEHYDDHYAPKGYLVYKANDRWTVKGGVATGFKTPTLLQTHNGITGTTDAGQTYTLGNPNLKPETSLNKEIGVYYSDPSGLKGNLTYFNTDYKNKFSTQTVGGYKQAINEGRAHVQGVEAATTIPLAKDVRFKLNYTWILSKITEGPNKGKSLNGIARHSVNAKIDWDINKRTNWWFEMEYKNRMHRDHAGSLAFGNAKDAAWLPPGVDYFDSYAVFNTGISYKLSKRSTLAFNINNVFDKKFDETFIASNGKEYGRYISTMGRWDAGTYFSGRNYWLSYNYSF